MNDTEQAVLKVLSDMIGANQNAAAVTKLYDESSTIHDSRSRNRDGGRLTVRAWRIDLPMLPWTMRRIYAVQRFLTACDWEEAENELPNEWELFPADNFHSDALAIRYAIGIFDGLGPELAQRVFESVEVELAERKRDAIREVDRDLPF